MTIIRKYRNRTIKVLSWSTPTTTGTRLHYAYGAVLHFLADDGMVYHSLTFEGASCKQRAEKACQDWIDIHYPEEDK